MRIMHLKSWIRILIITVLCISFVGCNNAPKSTLSGNSKDRYKDIINTKKDTDKLAVYFIDLPEVESSEDKSGDSTLLISPEGEVMLIDAGQEACGADIVKLLKDLEIEKVDYFVATHPHIDHIGGFKEIVKEYEVGMLYRTKVEYTTDAYKNFVTTYEDMKIPVTYLEEGDSIMFGEKISVKIYNPPTTIEYPKDYPDNSTQFVNDTSLLMKFTYGESTAIFGGDLYISQERELIKKYGDELQADVAKANHHGSDTSNSNRWIKTIQPKYIVAMNDLVDGMSVYQNYKKAGSAYYHTFLNGIVKITLDNEKNYNVIPQFDNWNNSEQE